MLYEDYETVCDNCSLIVDECKCDVECSLCGFQHELCKCFDIYPMKVEPEVYPAERNS
jgi:hypothetical protein